MSPIHFIQFILFSTCISLFSIFTYLVFYLDLFTTNFNELQTEYDFIIVGAGTAGCLIAHRIASETNYTFVVLEAGGKGHSFHSIPAFGPLLHKSVFDWKYETVPQDNACFAMENSKCKQTQGKIFGGSSRLNNMIHVRGNSSHYVKWFHNKYTKDYIEEQFHYVESNILKLGNVQYNSPLADAVINAGKELGYNKLYCSLGMGFSKSILSQNQGKRWTTCDNLASSKNIATNVLVKKLVIKNTKCIGVKINYPNKMTLLAKKGVIVSSGTYNSPKLLQLSGIGPAKLLKSHNIPVIKELPVGKNLQDHIGTGLDLVLFDKPQSVGMFDIMNLFNIYKYFIDGKGPLTTPGCEVVGFVSTNNDTVPNLQFMVIPVGITADRGSQLRSVTGITNDVWRNYFEKVFDKHTSTFFSILLHPKSRGEVEIKSKDPYLPPLINPKYLSHRDDINTLVESVKIIKNFLETKAMKAIGAQLNTNHFPGCENFEFFTNSYLECYVKHLTLSSYHPVGTCSMGLPGSNNAVVDTSFRVIGIKNLYVVDGSVLPTLPSGNINAAIAMMANIFFENNIMKSLLQDNNFCNKITFKEFVLSIYPVR